MFLAGLGHNSVTVFPLTPRSNGSLVVALLALFVFTPLAWAADVSPSDQQCAAAWNQASRALHVTVARNHPSAAFVGSASEYFPPPPSPVCFAQFALVHNTVLDMTGIWSKGRVQAWMSERLSRSRVFITEANAAVRADGTVALR